MPALLEVGNWKPRGRPAEGPKSLGGVLSKGRRVQRVYGGPGIEGSQGTLPDPASGSYAGDSFQRLLLDTLTLAAPGLATGPQQVIDYFASNPADPASGNALLRGVGGNFRGGSTSGTASPARGIGQARGTFGLSPTERRVSHLVGAFPGFGLPSLATRAVHSLFGPTFGVVGSETIAPKVGTAAFGRTVRGGSFGSNRGVGSRGGGFGHFGGPR